MRLFENRFHAGKMLADLLEPYANNAQTLVLALPRGGVPVAFEVAKRLRLPLDVWLVRKLGHPLHKELAMGAISLGNVKVYNEELLKQFALSHEEMNAVAALEEIELERRNRRYRDSKPIPRLSNKTIILIDDGMATGATMRAAVTALRKFNPAKIIAAVPVGSTEACQELENIVDELICLYTPEPFGAVGAWYESFSQTTDHEVNDCLKKAENLLVSKYNSQQEEHA
ncbi:MAG: phosphoribosyl transferase [Gammaproteobacteria bacterium]|jgi:putative phosphoribosyl transferase|nr:phosphoribosyl transferase [Gammaproteobacteria bacterium]